MARQKSTKSVQIEEKKEVIMTEAQVLESLETEIDKARLELEKTKKEIEEIRTEIKVIDRRGEKKEEPEEPNFEKKITVGNKALKEKILKQKEIDNQKVTGKFINRRHPGASVKLTYMRYEDDPVKWYEFEDGKVYTIPKGFMEEIRNHYYKPHFIQKEGVMDPNRPSSQIQDVDTSNKLYDFVPVNF